MRQLLRASGHTWKRLLKPHVRARATRRHECDHILDSSKLPMCLRRRHRLALGGMSASRQSTHRDCTSAAPFHFLALEYALQSTNMPAYRLGPHRKPKEEPSSTSWDPMLEHSVDVHCTQVHSANITRHQSHLGQLLAWSHAC